MTNHQWGKNTPDTSIKNHTVVEGKPGPRAKPLQRKPHPTQKPLLSRRMYNGRTCQKGQGEDKDRKELRSPGRWPPNAPYSCHGYTDRDSNATFPHGKHGPSQVLKTASYSGKFINLHRWYCRLLLLRALVSRSACCSDVDTNFIEMSPDLNNPRMKWYLTSMCLLRA